MAWGNQNWGAANWAAEPVIGTAIENPSFEIAGLRPGEAESWLNNNSRGGEELAVFESSIVPFDNFESGWGNGNQLIKHAFEESDLELAPFNDVDGARVEKFDFEWKRPIIIDEVSFDQPPTSLTVGKSYRNKLSGSIAKVLDLPGGNNAKFTDVDFGNAGKGFADAASFNLFGEPILAELNKDFEVFAEANGVKKQFGGTLANTDIHEKQSGRAATFSIEVTISSQKKTITDDGSGNLIATSGVLNTTKINTLNYATGVFTFTTNTAPDVGTKVLISHHITPP